MKIFAKQGLATSSPAKRGAIAYGRKLRPFKAPEITPDEQLHLMR